METPYPMNFKLIERSRVRKLIPHCTLSILLKKKHFFRQLNKQPETSHPLRLSEHWSRPLFLSGTQNLVFSLY